MTDTIATGAKIGIRRLAGNIGAEITGADTRTELGDDAVAQIRRALLDHKVVFLRGQSLDYARQVAFAERLGPLTPPWRHRRTSPSSRRSTRARACGRTTGTPT
jgi:alpha-ketoglutarate-dependent sulfate ester dioxygenase